MIGDGCGVLRVREEQQPRSKRDTMAKHHVVLVPGFFGFGNLGSLTYFVGVKQALEKSFAEQQVDVEVTEVPTLPTASIRHRAALVLETLARVSAEDDAPLHVIGHSTGGLDARLAIAPTASLPTQVEFDPHERVRSLVTVATPHFGTPLATAFSSAMGKPLLHLAALSVSYLLQYGRLPLGVLLKMGEIVTKLDDRIGLTTPLRISCTRTCCRTCRQSGATRSRSSSRASPTINRCSFS